MSTCTTSAPAWWRCTSVSSAEAHPLFRGVRQGDAGVAAELHNLFTLQTPLALAPPGLRVVEASHIDATLVRISPRSLAWRGPRPLSTPKACGALSPMTSIQMSSRHICASRAAVVAVTVLTVLLAGC